MILAPDVYNLGHMALFVKEHLSINIPRPKPFFFFGW